MIVEWFQNNFMNLNQDKGYLVISGYKSENVEAKIGDEVIWEVTGFAIDRNRRFDDHAVTLQ